MTNNLHNTINWEDDGNTKRPILMVKEMPIREAKETKDKLTDDMTLAERLRILQMKQSPATPTPSQTSSESLVSVNNNNKNNQVSKKKAHQALDKNHQKSGDQSVTISAKPRPISPVSSTISSTSSGSNTSIPSKRKNIEKGPALEASKKKPLSTLRLPPLATPRSREEPSSLGEDEDEDGISSSTGGNGYNVENDGTIKWTTLEHNGIYFPPPYQPHGIPMLYEGKPIALEAEAEEVATFFAGIIGTDHYDNPIFRRNFWEDFREILRQINSTWQSLIQDFDKCDFTPLHQHLQILKEKKKSLTKEEKEQAKAEKTKIDAHYGVAILDGKPEKVGNFRMEPPGLFRGRGKHPKAGKLKGRIHPENVTINIGPGARIPEPPLGHQWGKVISDNTVTWLATWTEPINRHSKYVFLAAGSSLKAQSDLKKFETARRLKQHVDRIRAVNFEELRSKEMAVRQRATALWLIDRLALRAGNEKGDDEADTVGCCSLRCEHIRLQEPNVVIFDFLGKDSIRYYNEVPVDSIIFKNLGIFMRAPKKPSDPIFDRLTTGELNKYLNGLMPGLTAKVFRTYNASHVFQEELEKMPPPDASTTVHDLVLSYNRANRQVAILCNHQRAVPKTHQQSMIRLEEKILTMKYQRHLVRQELRKVLGKKELKTQLPAALEPESDMDEATIKKKAEEAEALEKVKAEKSEESQSANSPKKGSTTATSSSARQSSPESLIKKFNSLTARIEAATNQKIDRDENKTTALGTSKTNYIDPRITYAWCQNNNVPIEKLFPKTLREKFKWASDVDKNWKF